jgi:hypothetical protein
VLLVIIGALAAVGALWALDDRGGRAAPVGVEGRLVFVEVSIEELRTGHAALAREIRVGQVGGLVLSPGVERTEAGRTALRAIGMSLPRGARLVVAVDVPLVRAGESLLLAFEPQRAPWYTRLALVATRPLPHRRGSPHVQGIPGTVTGVALSSAREIGGSRRWIGVNAFLVPRTQAASTRAAIVRAADEDETRAREIDAAVRFMERLSR